MESWTTFLVAAAAMAMIPGANQVLGLQNAATRGVAFALVGLVGRFAAFAVLIAAVTAGLGALLVRSATAFEVLRWLGVAYLLWLGLSTLRRAGRAGRHPGAEPEEEAARPVAAARREFLTALTNPKALLLFASFVPQFVPAGSPPGTLALLAVVYVGVEALAALVYLAAGRALRGRDGSLRVPRRRLDQGAGVAFLGFGGYLAASPRP